MIKSGGDIEKINEKIAILRNEIEQAGKLGLLNINKYCENFTRRILELTYGHKLINLNDETMNFPGLDIGSDEDGIAYQITSENDNAKINDTLEIIIRHGSQKRFPKIKFFILSDKKISYNIKPISDPTFVFDWKTDVMDFTDILKKISFLSPNQIKNILNFIEAELPYTINELKGNEVIQENLNQSLINIKEDMIACKLNFYEHFSIKLTMYGDTFSVPTLYNGLNEILNSDFKKSYLGVFSRSFQKKGVTPKEIIYELPLMNTGASNYFKHHILSIKPNSIHYEIAYYSQQEEFIGNSNFEVGGLLNLLIALNHFYKAIAYRVDASIDHLSNGKCAFHPQNNICSVRHTMSTYYLDSPNSFSRMIKSIDNVELLELVRDVINGFVVGPISMPYENPSPFLIIDENTQLHAIQALKTIIGPTLGELDN